MKFGQRTSMLHASLSSPAKSFDKLSVSSCFEVNFQSALPFCVQDYLDLDTLDAQLLLSVLEARYGSYSNTTTLSCAIRLSPT
jgi:hypothetical protein